MKKLVMIILALLFFSCKEEKEKQMSDNLKNIILDYQKKYPFKEYENNQKGKKYVYTVSFSKDSNDTLVYMCRSSNGILPDLKGYGIYSDDTLKETFIYDEKNFSRKFIFQKINKIDKSYYSDIKGGFYESHPPMYTYRVRKKELKLVRIDTFWNHWD